MPDQYPSRDKASFTLATENEYYPGSAKRDPLNCIPGHWPTYQDKSAVGNNLCPLAGSLGLRAEFKNSSLISRGLGGTK